MKNFKGQGRDMSLVATAPADPVSGDPVLWGTRPGVAITDKRADTGETTIRFYGIYELPVLGDDGAPSAVADGDELYYNAGVISKNTGGTKFGWANGTVTAGATTTINVVLLGS